MYILVPNLLEESNLPQLTLSESEFIMPIPSFQALFLPILRALANQAALSLADVRAHVQESEGLSESDCRQRLASGLQTVFENRIYWAVTHLVKAGLVDRPSRGHCKLTDSGEQFLAENPVQMDIATLRRFPAYEEWRSTFSTSRAGADEDSLDGEEGDDVRTPVEEMERAYNKLQSMLEAEVLEYVRKSPPAFLEKVVIDLLIAMGYGGGNRSMGHVTGGSGDGGIDGKIREDALGLDEIYVQAKKYEPNNLVSTRDLRDFVGALDSYGINKGVFVTSSDFSGPARDFPTTTRTQKRIILIDGKELARLMVFYDVGVRSQTAYNVKQIDRGYYDLE